MVTRTLERLHEELRGISEKETVPSCVIDRPAGEETSGQSSPGSPYAVYPDHVQRVVVSEACFEIAGMKAQMPPTPPIDDRRERSHIARGRRDCHQSGHGAGGRPEDGGLAAGEPLRQRPGQGGRGRGDVGGHECAGRQRAGAEGAAGIEPEPSEPQHAPRPSTRQRQVMGRHGLGANSPRACPSSGRRPKPTYRS